MAANFKDRHIVPAINSRSAWILIWVLAFAVSLGVLVANKSDDNVRGMFSDQSAHIMAAMSVWNDFDLRYTLADLDRFTNKFPSTRGPIGLFLKQNSTGDLFYAKPILYAVVTAPFYGLFGSFGFVVANLIALSCIAFLVAKIATRVYGVHYGQFVAAGYIFFSPHMAWVSIAHPDLFIAFLLFFGGYFLLTAKSQCRALVGGALLGLALYEKVTFAIVVPFLFVAVDQLTPKQRFYSLLALTLAWAVPTSFNVVQDGTILPYQGLRFYTSRQPFPLEAGWIPPVRGLTEHVFDLTKVAGSMSANLLLIPSKLADGLFGRQTGIAIYFPVALFFLSTSILTFKKKSILIVLGFFSYLLVNWLAFPMNGFGGAGSYGSRYLLQVLPLAVLALIPCFEGVRRYREIGWRIFGAVSIFLSVVLQYKIYPLNESLVRNPSSYLTSLPAEVFPLERSLLPSLPIYIDRFRECKQGTCLYRITDFGYEFGDRHVGQSKIVLYQFSSNEPPPDLYIEASSGVDVKLSAGDVVIWHGVISPVESRRVSVAQSVFSQPFFDLLAKKQFRWGEVDIEVRSETSNRTSSSINVSFLPDANHDFVAFNSPISVREFSDFGIRRRFGWSKAEQWGVWTSSSYADLLLNLPESHRGRKFCIKLDIQAYVPPEHPKQVIEVYINGVLSDKLDVGKEGWDGCISVSENQASVKRLQLGFKMLNPIAPKDLGYSEDDRLLGLGLKSLTLVSEL